MEALRTSPGWKATGTQTAGQEEMARNALTLGLKLEKFTLRIELPS